MPSLIFLGLSLFLAAAATSQAQVPPDATFSLENSDNFGDYIVEYFGSYRALFEVFNSPFQLCFFNTTPSEYTLALRMGLVRDESLFRWVWEANRGNPVGENATFSLRHDGNLVLANADGRVVWQTNTIGKGVTGFKLLSNGNMVLHDKNGRFVWQSFDSPTDTLLVGQSLRVGSKLVSRLSNRDNKNGPYALDLKPEGMFLYYKNMLYHSFLTKKHGPDEKLTNVTMQSEQGINTNYIWEVSLGLSNGGQFLSVKPKYNATLSFLRLGIDGSIKFYTYYANVSYLPWSVVYELFRRDGFEATECQLPERCGSLGVCEDSQCVACPTEKGLLGWSKTCAAKKVSCNPSQFHYYKVEGVDHFLSNFNRGSVVSEIDCGKKCTSDCKCMGYFYNKDTSRCWQASELKTLAKVANSSHVGYIKTPNK